jgi:hypothetical protein
MKDSEDFGWAYWDKFPRRINRRNVDGYYHSLGRFMAMHAN